MGPCALTYALPVKYESPLSKLWSFCNEKRTSTRSRLLPAISAGGYGALGEQNESVLQNSEFENTVLTPGIYAELPRFAQRRGCF